MDQIIPCNIKMYAIYEKAKLKAPVVAFRFKEDGRVEIMVFDEFLGVLGDDAFGVEPDRYEFGEGEDAMKKSKTDTGNGLRMCKDGTMEPMRQRSKMEFRMFQANKTKKRGRRH